MSWTPQATGTRTKLWRGIRWASALFLASIAVWLSMRQIQWATLQTTLTHVNLPLLALGLGTVLVTTAAKAARWGVLLRLCEVRTRRTRVLRVLFIGQMGNSFLPARLGDVARAALLGPQATGGLPAVLGTIVVEKALDGIMGVSILIGLVLWTPLPVWLHGPLLGLAMLTGVLLALLTLVAARREWATELYKQITRWLPAGVQASTRQILSGFALGLDLFRQPASALTALAWSVVVWSVAALTNVVTLAALDIQAPRWSTWLVLVTGYAAMFLPAVPAQVGVFEYACILALTAAGVSQEEALAFGLILHLLVYGPPAILGPVSMAVEGSSWARLKKARDRSLEGDRDLA